jgi:hypothetical protein
MDSDTNYYSIGKLILLFVALVLVGQTVFAQKTDAKSDTKEDKIKVKIMMEKDGKQNSFEKEYKDEDEMKNDPKYKAFKDEMGLDDEELLPPPPPPGTFAFGHGMRDVNGNHIFSDSIDGVPLPPPPAPPFSDEDRLRKTMAFHHFSRDSVHSFQIEEEFIRADSMKGGEKHVFEFRGGRPGHKMEVDRMIIRKKITIEDVADKSSDLKLQSLNYFPNPNKGSFRLQFESAKKDPVTIKVHNEKGELVYMDKVDGNEGKYDKQVDLSDKQKGTYFLELAQKGKTIRKKIIVE